MADLVNLRQWKKRLARADAETSAKQNRAAYGMPKSLKIRLESEAAKSAGYLDQRKLEPKTSV